MFSSLRRGIRSHFCLYSSENIAWCFESHKYIILVAWMNEHMNERKDFGVIFTEVIVKIVGID